MSASDPAIRNVNLNEYNVASFPDNPLDCPRKWRNFNSLSCNSKFDFAKFRIASSKRTIFLLFLYLVSGCVVLSAETVIISQIDNSFLIINQTVKAYVSVIDDFGNSVLDLSTHNFEIFESSERWPEKERKIISCEQGVNMIQGINLMLVLDNSGSMYYDTSGKITDSENEKIWRITHAKNAVRSLLGEIKNPKDRVAFMSFNLKIGSMVKPTSDKVMIERALEDVEKPSKAEAYTELYETLYSAVDFLRSATGRKVIILLSDGENFPEKNNPHFLVRYGLEGAIEFAQDEGISVFTIGLTDQADADNLARIARVTGGLYFPVDNPQDLERLYSVIRNQILHEYLITYTAGTEPSENTTLRIVYQNGNLRAENRHSYYTAPLFGLPQDNFFWQAFLTLPIALLLLWLLSKLKFERKNTRASLEILSGAGRRSRTRPLAISSEKTIAIGGNPEADLTVEGDPKVTMLEAKIENQGGVFTIAAAGSPITINNQTVKTKVLRSGDLITVGDTTIVFDAGTLSEKQTGRKAARQAPAGKAPASKTPAGKAPAKQAPASKAPARRRATKTKKAPGQKKIP